MAYTTINKSTDYFNTKLYTGNGSTNAINRCWFSTRFVGLKIEVVHHHHALFDAVRGTT